MTTSFSPLSTYLPPTPPTTPTVIPPLVYRVHRASSQTRYSFGTGFIAKNQTTILNSTTSLSRFATAHLHQQTNISSPFISVYDNRAHAENVAQAWVEKYREVTWVVTVDTEYLARGPVFRAADLLGNGEGGKVTAVGDQDWLHRGEYLVMYRVPVQAVRNETPFGRGVFEAWRTVGFIGGA